MILGWFSETCVYLFVCSFCVVWILFVYSFSCLLEVLYSLQLRYISNFEYDVSTDMTYWYFFEATYSGSLTQKYFSYLFFLLSFWYFFYHNLILLIFLCLLSGNAWPRSLIPILFCLSMNLRENFTLEGSFLKRKYRTFEFTEIRCICSS